jgi:glycosyltransferase involved in cell wall biosynthesis
MSYPAYECIVVDDCSFDRSAEIAASFGVEVIRLSLQKGAAYARNKGAEAAKGEILLFVDADVVVYPDSLEKINEEFLRHPEIDALFGTYDDMPGQKNFLSQYKNLFHHYIHQTSSEDASTFWTACGAVKRDVFFDAQGFDESCRMMEDIDLGYRMKAMNYSILLMKRLVVTHLKHYSLSGLLKSDLFDRAIPWTVLMLKNRHFKSDLNIKLEHKISALIIVVALLSLLISVKYPSFLWTLPACTILFFVFNRDFYRFFIRKRGYLFAARVVPLHCLYYLYSIAGFIAGYFKYLRQERISEAPATRQ